MNLGKSVATFSESDSKNFHLGSLFEDTISDVYFSLFLYSTNHHGVKLVLGMYEGGKPFALVEIGMHDQHTWSLE